MKLDLTTEEAKMLHELMQKASFGYAILDTATALKKKIEAGIAAGEVKA